MGSRGTFSQLKSERGNISGKMKPGLLQRRPAQGQDRSHGEPWVAALFSGNAPTWDKMQGWRITLAANKLPAACAAAANGHPTSPDPFVRLLPSYLKPLTKNESIRPLPSPPCCEKSISSLARPAASLCRSYGLSAARCRNIFPLPAQ